jgi:hypothetical protein
MQRPRRISHLLWCAPCLSVLECLLFGMNSGEKHRFRIPLARRPLRSLCWYGDELVDLAGGGTRFGMDGATVPAAINWAYPFDSVVISSDGTYRVIYQRLGTKGLLLRGNKSLREINRSYYHAHVYEYPLAIVNLPNSVVGLAHCPEGYNRLEFEEIESGQKLTLRSGESPDFFHSRLQVSPDGAYLLSAGWVWHPLDFIHLFSIHDAVKYPDHLDKPISMNLPDEFFEVNTATFQSDGQLLLTGRREDENTAVPYVALYGIKEGTVKWKCALESVPGTIMPVGQHHFVGFYEHPKLFEISTGKVIQSWPELNSGKQNSSIIWHQEQLPLLAMDPVGKRFAVADAEGITVIQLR